MTFQPNLAALDAAAAQVIDCAFHRSRRADELKEAREMLTRRNASADWLQWAINTLTRHGDWIDAMRAEMLAAALRRKIAQSQPTS